MYALAHGYLMLLFALMGIGAVLFFPALCVMKMHENYTKWRHARHYQKQMEKIDAQFDNPAH